MQLQEIAITIGVTIIGFFLSKFYTQNENVLKTVIEIKIEQAKKGEKLNHIEQKIADMEDDVKIFKRALTQNTEKNGLEKRHK